MAAAATEAVWGGAVLAFNDDGAAVGRGGAASALVATRALLSIQGNTSRRIPRTSSNLWSIVAMGGPLPSISWRFLRGAGRCERQGVSPGTCWLLLLCLLGLLPVGACARTPAPPALRVAVAAAPEALDPRFATSALAVRLSQLVAPPLCVLGDDLRPQLVLAQEIRRIDDLNVEATLRSGLRFPPALSPPEAGQPVSSSDVAFSFASVQDPAFGSPHRHRLDALDHVEIIDADTVHFHLRRAHAPFILDVICGVGVLSQRACSDVASCRFHPVGAGAWRVAAVGVDGFSFARVTAHIDLDVRIIKDGTARLLAVAAGDIDVVAGDVAPWDAATMPPSLAVHRVAGLGFSYLGLNASRLSDDERRAIVMAVDVDALLSGRVRSLGRRASGLLPPDHWAKDPALKPGARDVEGARVLLGARRVRVTLLVTPDRLRRSLALAVRAQLAEVGIEVDVVVRDWSVVYEELKAGRFDLVLAKWTPVAEPDLLTTVFHSRSIPTKDTPGGNRGAFVDVDVDAWLDAARISNDDVHRATLYGLVERRVQERAALLPLWFDDEVWVSGPRVLHLAPARTGSWLPLQDVIIDVADPAAGPQQGL